MSAVNEAIVRYYDLYHQGFRRKTGETIGAEFEMPVVDEEGQAADFRSVWMHLLDCGFLPLYENETVIGFSRDGCTVTLDAGYCTVELILPPCQKIQELDERFLSVMRDLVRVAGAKNLKILGYGIQPYTPASSDLWVPRVRYRLLQNAFLGKGIHEATITASVQSHISVSAEEVIPVFNLFNRISWAIIALMANSPVYSGTADPFIKSRREVSWDRISYTRTGVPVCNFSSLKDYCEYLLDNWLPFVSDNGTWKRCFYTLRERFIQAGYSDEEALIQESCFWFNARPRVKHGTVEVRMADEQPPARRMVLPALVKGLVQRINCVNEAIAHLTNDECSWLRYRAVHRGVHFDHKPLIKMPICDFLRWLVNTARDGLIEYGFSEEKYLDPLFEQLDGNFCPADRAIDAYHSGRFLEYIDEELSFQSII